MKKYLFILSMSLCAISTMAQRRHVVAEVLELIDSTRIEGFTTLQTLENGIDFQSDSGKITRQLWANIKQLESIKPVSQDKAGMNAIVTTRSTSNQFIGFISVQVPGKYIVIENDTIRSSDIASIAWQPINEELSIWEQVQFIETVTCKDKKEISGVIIEKNYENKESSFFRIETKDGRQKKVMRKDIESVKYDLNPDYLLSKNVTFTEKEIVINGKLSTPTEQVRQTIQGYIWLDQKVQAVPVNGKEGEGKCSLSLYAPKTDNLDGIIAFRVEKAEKQVLKKLGYQAPDTDTKTTCYQLADPLSGGIRPSQTQVSYDETCTYSFTLPNDGLYLFYQASANRALLIDYQGQEK